MSASESSGRELSGPAIVHQADAFEAYCARGGHLTLDDWMAGKDLAPADREALREEIRARVAVYCVDGAA